MFICAQLRELGVNDEVFDRSRRVRTMCEIFSHYFSMYDAYELESLIEFSNEISTTIFRFDKLNSDCNCDLLQFFSHFEISEDIQMNRIEQKNEIHKLELAHNEKKNGMLNILCEQNTHKTFDAIAIQYNRQHFECHGQA